MRHFGTLMLVGAAAMLLFPVWWESREPGNEAPAAAGLMAPAGQSTLLPADFAPAWRAPLPGEGG